MKTTMNPFLRFLSVVALATGQANATTCERIDYSGISYTVCTTDLSREHVHVYYLDDSGAPFGTFDRLDKHLRFGGKTLDFAMNGGMFQDDLRPVGLLVIDGKEIRKIDLRAWPGEPPPEKNGNYYIIPNGVFWIKAGKAFITDTLKFQAATPRPDVAIQSGPLLIEGGRIPAVLKGYKKGGLKRNGICVATATQIKFVISNTGISIGQFATFMEKGLQCADALYLDGACRSVLFSTSLARNDISCVGKESPKGLSVGQIIATIRNK